MAPKADVKVALSALHADSRIWSNAGRNIHNAQVAAGGIQLTAAQFSYFGDQAGLTRTYADLQRKVVSLLGQAATNFGKISTTLVQVANEYQANEERVTDSLNSIH
ncbi:MAG TPA: hypothetical protein VJX10_01935 [Pseudonocardiaceae bacterium]|nr:hypothetical protein [Pseudonocardiaceae bacterium]